MKTQEFDVNEVLENPAIAARAGALDAEHVMELAKSFAERIEAGLEHQIQPGVVRMNGSGHPEVIVGRHRLGATRAYNESKGENDEALPFIAIVIRADDEQGLITAITENEYRLASNIFDRSESMQKLVDLGKSQKEVARIFNLSEGTVTQTLKAGKLQTKFKKAVLNGDLEQDAALMIADLDTDDELRMKIFEECLNHRQKFDDIMAKRETKAARAEADKSIEDAKAAAETAAKQVEEATQKQKDADKAFVEVAKESGKTKDLKTLEVIREKQDAVAKAKKEAEEELAKAEKLKEETKAKLARAKEKKAEVLESTKASKTKVTPEDVERNAAEKGLKKKSGKNAEAKPLSRKEFIVALEAISEEKNEVGAPLIPKSACDLIGAIEAFFDAEKSSIQLRNAFNKFCVPDSQAQLKARSGKPKAAAKEEEEAE